MKKLLDYNNVVAWGADKGILDKSSPLAQSEKFMEEALEFIDEVKLLHTKPYPDSTLPAKMEYGDVLVTLILYAELSGWDMDECLTLAYNKIATRNGKIIDGLFVKDMAV